MSLYLALMMLIIWNKEHVCLSGKYWASGRIQTRASQFRRCLIQRQFPLKERFTTEWGIQLWAATVRSLPKWEVLALTAVPEWAAQSLGLVLFSTTRATTLRSAPKNPEMTWTIFKVFELHAD